MGTFDTYDIAWGDSSQDVQTKHFDSLMRTWSIGDRIPLCERPMAGSALGLDPKNPMDVLHEDTFLADGWSNPYLCERHFVFGHIGGRLVDYAASMSEHASHDLSAMLQKAWSDPRIGPGLARRASLLQERNAMAEAALLSARANIDPVYRRWRKSLAKKASERDAVDTPKPTFLEAIRAYRGPDLSGLSRLDLTTALLEMSDHWQDAMKDFDGGIEHSLPSNRAQESALACLSSHWPTSTCLMIFGAPNIDGLAALSEPENLSGKTSVERALSLLRAGSWRLFEVDAKALTGNKSFVHKVNSALSLMCYSRVGCQWVAGFLSRQTDFAVGHVVLDNQPIPLLDWMVVHMGLPTRLVLPLIESGYPLSSSLAHHCLSASHQELLPAILKRTGGAGHVSLLGSDSFAVQAARCGSLQALQALAAEGILHPSDADSQKAAQEAYKAESKENGPWTVPTDNLGPMGPALSCAVFMHEFGLRSEAPMSDRLLSRIAVREKAALSDLIIPTPTTAKSHRI